MINNYQKEIHTKLTKGLLDMIVLQIIDQQPMHGYQIIRRIRRNFGVCVGVSTIYPLLSTLEKKGFLKSDWNMSSEKPKKVYRVTDEGQNILKFTEDSLNLICKNLAIGNKIRFETINLDPTHSSSNAITFL